MVGPTPATSCSLCLSEMQMGCKVRMAGMALGSDEDLAGRFRRHTPTCHTLEVLCNFFGVIGDTPPVAIAQPDGTWVYFEARQAEVKMLPSALRYWLHLINCVLRFLEKQTSSTLLPGIRGRSFQECKPGVINTPDPVRVHMQGSFMQKRRRIYSTNSCRRKGRTPSLHLLTPGAQCSHPARCFKYFEEDRAPVSAVKRPGVPLQPGKGNWLWVLTEVLIQDPCSWG